MDTLTKTQTVIVQLLSDGNSAGEVAEYRCRSLGTIRKHIDLAKERMGARSTGHLIKLAVQQGLINSIFACLIVSQAMPGSTTWSETVRPDAKGRAFFFGLDEPGAY